MSKKKLEVEFDKDAFRVISQTTAVIAREMAKSIDNNFMTELIMIKGFVDDVKAYKAMPKKFWKRRRILADAIVMEASYVTFIVEKYLKELPPVKFKKYSALDIVPKKKGAYEVK